MALKAANHLETWTEPGSPITIHYSLSVMEEISREAAESLRALPRGGIETGGVLYGTRGTNAVWIHAIRPLECEHAFGPTFVLSLDDEARLKKLIAAPRTEPGLEGLEALGCYHSRNRTGIDLSAPDRDLFNRYFPEPWQVLLIVRPDQGQPTRAGFFFREPDGSTHAEPSERELLPAPGTPARLATPAEPPKAKTPAPTPSRPERVGIAAGCHPRTAGSSRWLAAGVLGLLGGIGLMAVLNRLQEPPPLELGALDSQGQLRIFWDRNAAPVRSARQGVLEIVDGPRRLEVSLDSNQLRSGGVTYARQSDRVDVKLVLPQGDSKAVEGSVAFVGQTVPSAPAAPPPAAPDLSQALRQREDAVRERDEAQTEAEHLKTSLNKASARNKELEEAIRVLRNRIAVEVSRRH